MAPLSCLSQGRCRGGKSTVAPSDALSCILGGVKSFVCPKPQFHGICGVFGQTREADTGAYPGWHALAGFVCVARNGSNQSVGKWGDLVWHHRSEEHTSELQSLMRISYAVFCLKKKT